MKLGVIGTRSFDNYILLTLVLDLYRADRDVEFIVSGGRRKDGKGADTLVENYADMRSIPKIIYPPQFYFAKFPAEAFLARNTAIAQESDAIIGFWDGKSTGTLDTFKKAYVLGKQIFWTWENETLNEWKP